MTSCIAMVVHTPSSVEQEELVYRNEQDFTCPSQKVKGSQTRSPCPGAACRALGGVGGACPCESTLWGRPVADQQKGSFCRVRVMLVSFRQLAGCTFVGLSIVCVS